MRQLARVGINALFLRPRMGGLETYVRRLIPELVAKRPDVRFSLFLNDEGRDYLAGEAWIDGVEVVTHPLLGRRWFTAASEAVVLGEVALRRGDDLLHSVAMTGPLGRSPVHVVLVGDLIWLHDPESTGRVTATLWKTLVPPVVRRAGRVLTFSDATRQDLHDSLGVPREKVDVVPLGHGVEARSRTTGADDVRRLYGLGDGPVVLAVSSKRTHKNLVRLIQAFARVRERVPTATLVLPGNPTRHEEELKEEVARLGIADAVRFPAYVSPPDLEGLYATASSVVVPSIREGFGLPVLEAMQRGVPVAASNTSSLPEVGGDAARYFDPFDVESIARAVVELLLDRDLAATLATRGRVRAACFGWDRTAEGTIASYERAWADRR
jgi:glycosyltransferase involved in cell wall biosynthesis